MPLVTESCPEVKPPRFAPFQIMLMSLATKRAVVLKELIHKLLLEKTDQIVDGVVRFMLTSPTPHGMFEFENSLADQLRQIGLEVLQFAVNNLEPDEAREMPSRMRHDQADYSRKGRKTPHREGVACRFGMIGLRRWSYEPLTEEAESGLKSFAPLEELLGLVGGKATLALAEVIGRLSQERSETGVVEFLRREHGVTLASQSVCLIRDVVAQGTSKHLEDQQVQLLRNAIQTGQSQGQIIVAVGRDGIFVPMRGAKDDRWKEAAVGTVSIYLKPSRGELRRLCTVYLGQMPQPGQEELSDHLTSLLQRVLSDDSAQNVRLVYLTDAGHHPQDYYQRVLQHMSDPHRPGKLLEWTWIVDFFHASSRLDVLANVLFHVPAEAAEWVRRMRHCLKHESNAVFRILHSAAALKPNSLRGKANEDYEKAYQYLSKYRWAMDYSSYRSHDLPIGSGVTEAACKTVFTQRFKCSGMIWNRANDYDHRDPDAKLTGARSVLVLRLAVLSRVWPAVFAAFVATKTIIAKSIVNSQVAS
jgi:hypothetical protein